MTKQKTRAEKIKSSYRLENFKLDAPLRKEAKDQGEFSYLSSEYVVKDLVKTILYTVIILGILVFAKMKLG